MTAVTYTPPPPPPPLAPNGQPLADFPNRLVAYIVDSLIVAAVAMVFILPAMFAWFFYFLGQAENMERDPDGRAFVFLFAGQLVLMGVILVFSVAITYLYFVELQLRRGGQTFGKQIMKLWVIPVQPGETLTRMHLVKRWAVQSVVRSEEPRLNSSHSQ